MYICTYINICIMHIIHPSPPILTRGQLKKILCDVDESMDLGSSITTKVTMGKTMGTKLPKNPGEKGRKNLGFSEFIMAFPK